ncbi:hypothetical protein EV196_11327 [Mariniflexile fucanivorans]|uniref:Uncharacterized protein n=1 Tax=Mariniflexile fucanivorans TaxID=264023 RepID=A0A4R1R9W3_9FLAO|nr:hypothetical protein [Mariniflexile fucanivorans]TCL62486.1 hypothetical protein EV196_11327 [Mariniflexile fucanivorans]
MSANTEVIDTNVYEYKNIRIDKNFAFNIQVFRSYNEDAKIIKAILIYMAYDSQKDLFGFYRIDPEVFADVMFFQKSNLFRIHPNPKQFESINAQKLIKLEEKHGRMSAYRTWSNYIENALYILNTENILTDYRYKTDTKAVASVKRFNFIDEIEYELETVGKTKKIIYKYKPNEKFEENLKSYFLNTNVDIYNALKKPNLDDAYLELLNRINNCNIKNINSIAFNLNDFAAILSIKPYTRFSNYKSKINQKFETLKKAIGNDVKGLKLVWGKNSDHIETLNNALVVNQKNTRVKYDNIPILTWDKLTKEELQKKDTKTFVTLFNQELFKGLAKACFSKYENKIMDLSPGDKICFFYEWFFSSSDLDIKIIKYKDTYLEIYKTTKALPSFSGDFEMLIKALTSAYKKHKAISFNEEEITFSSKKGVKVFRHVYELLDYYKANFTL